MLANRLSGVGPCLYGPLNVSLAVCFAGCNNGCHPKQKGPNLLTTRIRDLLSGLAAFEGFVIDNKESDI